MASVDEQLAALDDMAPLDLRLLWKRQISDVVPQISPKLMRFALAWEIQVKAHGGLSRATRHKLDQLAQAKPKASGPLPGRRLVREWRGTVHVVTIGDDEVIRWDDRNWRSLSQVARAITGTRWSGPAFFGLKQKAKAA